MELGDIWLKVARNQGLTPQEEQFLRDSGKQVQLNNAYIAGLQQGSSSTVVNSIRTNELFIGKEVYSGISARYQEIGRSVLTSTYTDSASWVADYADFGFTTTSGQIRIPQTGRYQVIFQVSWDDDAPGVGIRDSGAKTNGSPSRPQDSSNSIASGSYTYLRGIDELEYNAGDLVKLTHWHNGGITLTLDAWIVFRKIR